MKVSAILSGEFTAGVRNRGADYFRAGAVHIDYGSPTEVRATVYGTETYAVEIGTEPTEIRTFCECPYFESDGACKHLWATILKAESKGYLSAARHFAGLSEPDGRAHAEPERPVFGWPDGGRATKRADWQRRLEEIENSRARPGTSQVWPERRQLLYVINIGMSRSERRVVLELLTRERKQKGDGWNRLKELRWEREKIPLLGDPADVEILSFLAGGRARFVWSSGESYVPQSCELASPLAGKLLPLMCATSRCFLRLQEHDQLQPLAWDAGGAWRFELQLAVNGGNAYALTGVLRRGEERMDVAAPLLIGAGLVFTQDRVAPIGEDTPLEWLLQLRTGGAIEIAAGETDELLGELCSRASTPPLCLPEELRITERVVAPVCCLHLSKARYPVESSRLEAELWFDYAGRRASGVKASRGFFDTAERVFTRRNREVEEAAERRLLELGVRKQVNLYGRSGPVYSVPSSRLPALVRPLIEEGWRVETDGKSFRRPGGSRLQIKTGIDWFELEGSVEYGETSAKLPDLLAALRRGDCIVRLGDGSFGVLPEEWLARFGPLAAMGDVGAGTVRFRRNQAGLLDALLAARPEVAFDEAFGRAREELRRFTGIEAAPQPAGFNGQLREYQRDGLGWLRFLRQFGFGGCLADDMGVGKTAQVLALLESLRAERAAGSPGEAAPSPWLVVVPRSLVFNWKQEAARFTPELRVLDYTGLARSADRFVDFDLVLTTYGTLRRDAARFATFDFDYVILDEAQAIKNANTESAKAVRLLRARNRLALSGTPIENHLGELWSLFEFLNPGMLGSASAFKMTSGPGRNPDEETRKLLAHALRPFILRRTKQQVARELPAKTEQTIWCELDRTQRRLYDELRDHYRESLLGRIERQGLAKSKIQVLEALLRLRQAACHPGLLDRTRVDQPSAKLESLLEQVAEVVDEGHKALIFSQFTSLLAIVRKRLEERGLVYEYLDGQTGNRQAPVERFQNDPGCPLFLISLKAGGLGLNLTAAEYVFLLDPWWNPAVEAQAIDRTHRIGQTRQVFAYRLIARDTVEEKVIELQRTKRDLADAIIGADNSVLRDLKREDLELLLS